MIFYIIFVASITTHIILANGMPKEDSPSAIGERSTDPYLVGNPAYICLHRIAVCGICDNDTLGNNDTTPANVTSSQDDFSDDAFIIKSTVTTISIIFFILLVFREAFQFWMSPKNYLSWSSRENYLEILIIFFSSIVLFHNGLQPYFAAITILLSWGELVLLVGRHPMLSTYIEMLKTVSWNFLKFLSWYAILIMAFALSFYILFRDNADPKNFFTYPSKAMFKTIVMLTGEFDASDIPFVEFPVVSHVVFVMFVFLIVIVLFNLLIGLAVVDTQAIKDDAELIGRVSRVTMVAHIERMVMDKDSWLARWSWMTSRVKLFHDRDDHAGHVMPNQGSELWLGPHDDERTKAPRAYCSLQCDVIKRAEGVMKMKDSLTELELIKKTLDVNTTRLADIEAMMRALEKHLMPNNNEA